MVEQPLLDMEKEIHTVEINGLEFVKMVGTAFRWFAERESFCTVTSMA